MNKLFTKIGAAIVGIAMAIGVGVAAGTKSSAKLASATGSNTVVFTMTGWGGITVSGYKNYNVSGSGLVTGSASTVAANAYGFVGNTGQVRGNKTSIGDSSYTIDNTSDSKNWHLYNTGAIPGAIISVSVVSSGTINSSNHFQNNMYISLGNASQGDATSTTTGTSVKKVAASGGAGTNYTTFSFTSLNSTNDYTFFKLYSNEKITAGSVTAVTVTVAYETEAYVTPEYASRTIYTSGDASLTSTTVGLTYHDFTTSPTTVTATSNNTSIIPDANCVIAGNKASVTISSNGVAGSAVITISATGGSETKTCTITITVEDNSKSLSSIAITTPATKTSYNEDDILDFSGLVVTASFSDSTSSDVTASCHFYLGESDDEYDDDELSPSDDTVTIKYTFAGTTKSASYSITVAAYIPNVYKKVTSVPASWDWRGTYLIVYETGNIAFDGSKTGDDLNVSPNSFSVTIDKSKSPYQITGSKTIDTTKVFSILRDGTNYYLRSKSGYNIGKTGDSNGININSSTKYANAFDVDDIEASGGPHLRYNTSESVFRYYKSTTYTLQESISLYKLEDNGYVSEAGTYASTFLSSVTCGGTTGVNAGTITNASLDWDSAASTSMKSKFNALSADAQSYLANLSGNQTDGATGAAGAVGRYDYIVTKYGKATYSDFMNRVESGKLVLAARADITLSGNNHADDSALVIIVISSISLIAVGGFFMIRRRKEDK